jgi:hypothetical protein
VLVQHKIQEKKKKEKKKREVIARWLQRRKKKTKMEFCIFLLLSITKGEGHPENRADSCWRKFAGQWNRPRIGKTATWPLNLGLSLESCKQVPCFKKGARQ